MSIDALISKLLPADHACIKSRVTDPLCWAAQTYQIEVWLEYCRNRDQTPYFYGDYWYSEVNIMIPDKHVIQ